MQITLVRNATLIVDMAGLRLLIDPWLAGKGEGKNYSGRGPSPLVDLPMPSEHILRGIDAVLVSHLHSDHFDEAAQTLIGKTMPILCHVRDQAAILAMGFQDVRAIGDGIAIGQVRIRTTDGRHGPPEVLDDMGEVSGFLIDATGEPRLYWAGDTMLCPEVGAVLTQERPDIAVVHGCGALWNGKGPLVMDVEMIALTLDLAPFAQVIVTHLDAVDHATVSRIDIQAAAAAWSGRERLYLPHDGQALTFSQ